MQIAIGAAIGFGIYYFWGDVQPAVVHLLEWATAVVQGIKK